MAIFGMNGAWSAGLYLATMWALYGMKNAGFADDKELKEVVRLVDRKNIGEGVKAKSTTRKAAIKALREKRFAALTGERYKALAGDVAFQKEYMKQEWAR